MLALRRRVPPKLSTGTSALVLHVTIVAALCPNVALLTFASSITGAGVAVPFVALGGQFGADLNDRLSETTVMLILIAVYFLVGVFVVVRTVFLGGAAH